MTRDAASEMRNAGWRLASFANEAVLHHRHLAEELKLFYSHPSRQLASLTSPELSLRTPRHYCVACRMALPRSREHSQYVRARSQSRSAEQAARLRAATRLEEALRLRGGCWRIEVAGP